MSQHPDADPLVPTCTWEDALDQLEAHLRARRVSSLTRHDYLQSLGWLAERFAAFPPGCVTLQDLRAYQCELLTGEASRTARPLAAGTVARITSSWRALFSFLAGEGSISADPSLQLERPRLPRRAPGDVLTPDEVQRLLAGIEPTTARALRDRALLELMYATALRRAELLDLDLGDLDEPERRLTVRAGKGEKGRLLPVIHSAWQRLQDYLRHARPELQTRHPDSFRALFLSSRGRRLSGSRLGDLLRERAEAVGLTRVVTPHTLRRSCATHLMQQGVSLRHVQALLGHESLNTTAVYLRLDTSELRRSMLLNHPRERFEV